MPTGKNAQTTIWPPRALVWSLLLAISFAVPELARAQAEAPDGRKAVATREELQGKSVV